jgi:hypothetical protein
VRKTISIICLSILASACVDDVATDEASLYCEDCVPEPRPPLPPPPPIPPQPAPPPDYTYEVGAARFLLERAGAAIIQRVNDDPDLSGSLRWLGDPPTWCRYQCNTSPWNAYPGIDYVYATTHLKFRYSTSLTYRDINVPVQIRARCDGWETGAGSRRVSFVPQIAVISGGSWLESLANFFSNGYLSARINDAIAAEIGSGGGASIPLDGTCDSLGVRSGYPDHPELDAFTWDR